MIVEITIDSAVLCFHLYKRITRSAEIACGIIPLISRLISLKQYTTSIAIAQDGSVFPRYVMNTGVFFWKITNGAKRMNAVTSDMTRIRR